MSMALPAEGLFYEFSHRPSSPSQIGARGALAVSMWVSSQITRSIFRRITSQD